MTSTHGLRSEINSELEGINYRTQWIELSSQDYGVPQRRRRLFMVGFRDEAAHQRFQAPGAMFRQIANSVPSMAGAYMGAAIRLAPTGEDISLHALLRRLSWMSEMQRRKEQYYDPELKEDDFPEWDAAEQGASQVAFRFGSKAPRV